MDFIHDLYKSRQHLTEDEGVFNFFLKDQEGGGVEVMSIPVHRCVIKGKSELDLETIKEFIVPEGIGKRVVEEFIKFLYLEELDEEIGRDEGYNLLLLSILTKFKYKYAEKLGNLTYSILRRSLGIRDGRDSDPVQDVSLTGGRNDVELVVGSEEAQVQNGRDRVGGVQMNSASPVNGPCRTTVQKRKRPRPSTSSWKGRKSKVTKNCEDDGIISLKDKITKAKCGDTIQLLPGIYEISSLIQINVNNLIIQGAGVDKTVLEDTRNRVSKVPLFLVNGDGFVMRSLKIVLSECITDNICNYPTYPLPEHPSRPVIDIDSSSCLIEHVRFENCGIKVARSKNTLRNLNFHADKTLYFAISIGGSEQASVAPGTENAVRDVEIHNYETGVWLSDSQGKNQISNVKTTEVEYAVVIDYKAHHNEIKNVEYKCPRHSLKYGKNVEGSQAIAISHGATNNVVNGLRCFGFQTGMRVRSIFIGTYSFEKAPPPEGNVVENWEAEEGILEPLVCDVGGNMVY